jgi:hypothetical protein
MQETARRLIIAEIAQRESSKQNLEARLHGSSRKAAELQAESEKLQRINDACLLTRNVQHIDIATK